MTLPDAAPAAPNIVTIILDCVRWKSLSLGHGTRIARTPTMDALARKGTSFSRAVAPANWTVPAMMSVATGTYPSTHQRRSFVTGPAPLETAASWVARAGYETVMFTEQIHLVAGYGLEEGYVTRFSPADRLSAQGENRTITNQLFLHSNVLYSNTVRQLIQSVPPFIIPINLVNHQSEVEFKRRVAGPEIVSQFAEWMRVRKPGRPLHLLFNFVDGHEPYPRTDEWDSLTFLQKWYARTPKFYLLSVPRMQEVVPWREFEGGYLLAVESADAKVARVMAALSAAGELERSLIILTADHGQCFGEDGHVFHGNGAVDAVTRVPLVVVPPSGMSLPSRVDSWTSLCEIHGWMKATAKGLPPFGEDGRAPAPFAPELPNPETVYSEGNPAGDVNRSLAGIGKDRTWNHRLVAAYRGDEKYLWDMESGAVLHWLLKTDPDHTTPEILSGSERDRIRDQVFGPYERGAPSGQAQAEVVEREELTDKRMRSWGYD
ncbi:MAG: sulfatase-like hydrolase/transferase [Thermoplasmata archaeon]